MLLLKAAQMEVLDAATITRKNALAGLGDYGTSALRYIHSGHIADAATMLACSARLQLQLALPLHAQILGSNAALGMTTAEAL